MPIYEYQCDSCGHQFELLQKISDSPAEKCPSCNKGKVRKLVSAAAFHLKGTGWYVTDFRDKPKGEKGPEKTDQPAGDNGGKKAEPVKAKTEVKPADQKSAEKKTTDPSSRAVSSKTD